MKRIVLFIFFFSGVVIGLAQERYKIVGTVESVSTGDVVLIRDEIIKQDTLATTSLVDGRFEFSGLINEPVAVYVTWGTQQRGIPLILEGADFVINERDGKIVVKGGDLQGVYNQFNQINSSVLQCQKKMQNDFQVAEKANDQVMMENIVEQFNKELIAWQTKEKELLQKYANTYVAAYVVASGMQWIELELLKSRYALLGDIAKETLPGQAIADLIKQQEQVTEGNVAPDFTLKAADGSAVSVKDLGGKAKLIYFWASWSPRCRQENLNVLRIYQQYNRKGLEIISISLDEDRHKWLTASAEDGFIWKNVSELKGKDSDVAKRYFVKDIPYMFLLDENNVIVAKTMEVNELNKKIKELLKK